MAGMNELSSEAGVVSFSQAVVWRFISLLLHP